jgi:starch phosphorylase
MDLRWTWNHSCDELWRRLDPALWALDPHPNTVLQNVSPERLALVLADADFNRLLDQLVAAQRTSATEPAWFQRTHPGAPLTGVAYFCMEYMLSEALPIYSGGLGNVAGDQLKAASNLGVPVVGVGLLYEHGYFRQVIDRNGSQQAVYPFNDPRQLPVAPVFGADGKQVRVEIPSPGTRVWLRAWRVRVGRAILYLLDANDPANAPADQHITSELYGGDQELRLRQEIALGIGGWRLLAALGVKPEVCHLNEGHAAFALLERAREFMAAARQPFAVGLAATRAGNLFTTHTAVPAGFDRFPPELVANHLGSYARDQLCLSVDELLALGRKDPSAAGEPFNMAYLAMRGSGAINGVSQLHGQVSRQIFSPLFPRWPVAEVPVGSITNGVHMPTWDSAAADELWTGACGTERWRGTCDHLEADLRRVPDPKIWALRATNRTALVAYARAAVGRQMAAAGVGAEETSRIQDRLRPDVLTFGFARRFAAYKRPNLLLHDPARLVRILTDPRRPAQLILAGKAHPADGAGQTLIRQWMNFIQRRDINPPVVFLADYDMLMAEHLVQGVDVWINTPRRPWEASGTSGMKVLVNGGLNLSELDGWWAEAYQPDIGWALGDGREHGEDPAWDGAEAEALYERLEREVIPEFHARTAEGIPTAWVARIRESMARLTPQFSAGRAVREYTEQHYLPAAATYLARAAERGALARQICDWQQATESGWSGLAFGPLQRETQAGHHAFAVELHLNGLSPEGVRVELYADPLTAGGSGPVEMTCVQPAAGESGGCHYGARVPAVRAIGDYTVRAIPRQAGAAVPLESARILWQR